MRLGVLVPTRGVVMQSARRPPVDECWTMARLADNAGYDAVWVGDSIVAKPRLEPMTTLAYLAGITTRVRLGTAVLLPALRHPVVLAHQIATSIRSRADDWCSASASAGACPRPSASGRRAARTTNAVSGASKSTSRSGAGCGAASR